MRIDVTAERPGAPHKVDQTLFVDTPGRLGNCVAACIASHLGVGLVDVPHVLEVGAEMQKHTTDPEAPDRSHWWALTVGYFAAHGLAAFELASVNDADPGELVWVMGMSPRRVSHQVIYRDGVLWHDPHPSRDGVLDIREVLVWRPAALTTSTPTEGAADE